MLNPLETKGLDGERPFWKSALPMLALGAVVAAGCARGPDDKAIIAAIRSQWSADAQLKGLDLQATANHGEVTLTGTVPNDAVHLEAYKIATQVPGVRKVQDGLTVERAETAATAPASAEATAKSFSAAKEPVAPRKDRLKAAGLDDSRPAANASPASAAQTVAQAPAEKDAPSQASPQELPSQPRPQPPVQPRAVPASVPVGVTPPLQPREVQIPATTTLSIRMIDSVDSSVNRAGEIFHGALEAPVVLDDQVIVSRGADVYVRLVAARSAGHLKGKSELHLELVKMDYQGRSYQLVSSTYALAGESRGKNTAKKVGVGAVLGAVIGGLAGGGKGAAIGATVGGGGGAIYNGATRGKQVKIPAETRLDFQLDAPVTVSVMPRQRSATSQASAQ
jgi:BON domain